MIDGIVVDSLFSHEFLTNKFNSIEAREYCIYGQFVLCSVQHYYISADVICLKLEFL